MKDSTLLPFFKTGTRGRKAPTVPTTKGVTINEQVNHHQAPQSNQASPGHGYVNLRPYSNVPTPQITIALVLSGPHTLRCMKLWVTSSLPSCHLRPFNYPLKGIGSTPVLTHPNTICITALLGMTFRITSNSRTGYTTWMMRGGLIGQMLSSPLLTSRSPIKI